MKMLVAAAVAIIALAGMPQIAAAQTQTGNAPFCAQTAAGASCVYATMAECERATRGSTTQCITRTDARGVTGLGEPPARSPGVPTEPPPATGR